MSRVASHVPSLHVAESSQHLQSRQGSLDNLHVEQRVPLDDRSRVTSWTTSSAGTVMSPSPDTEWERQRLSVIKENGMHVSSSRSKTPVGGLTSREHGLPSGCAVDSERIYSALLRRLEETKRLQQQGELTDDLVPPRGISIEHLASRKRSPPTIRCVGPDDVFRDEKPEQAVDVETMTRTDGRIPPARSTSYQPYPKPAAGDGKGLSPERRTKAEAQPQGSPDRRSAFFASPTCHLFRTASPYRRALRENMRDAHGADQTYDGDDRCLSVLSALSLPTRCPSTTESENGAEQSDGASVYSCATQPQGVGQDVDDYEGAVDDQQPRAVVAAHDRNVSSTSSVEWKLWLSANVSKMETPSTTMSADSYGEVSYKSPAFGHVREEAEIESPGEVLKPMAGTNARPAKQSTDSPDTPCCRTRHDENSPPAVDESSCDTGSDEAYPNPWRDSLQASCHVAGGMKQLSSTLSCKTDGSPSTKDDHPLLRQRAQRRQRMMTNPHSAQSSPGLTAAVEKQFGKADMGSPSKKTAGFGEAASPKRTSGPEETTLGPTWDPGAETIGPDWEAQVMGSRRMVDLFLSSRRKRIESSRTETESENMSVAFV